jgi:mannose-6-phosphate isomerase-like protein (cupin superfamily)
MEARVVRYADLRPCTTAFIDARTPGSHLKENFTIIGPGVSENPDQYVHITEPHGFNIGGARQPPNILNSPHSHDTAEVFMVFSGTWRFYWGVDGRDGEAILTFGDVINLPTNLFRGFENVGNDTGFIFAVLGKDEPGRVTWAPQVLEAAKGHGLVLLEDGRLIDTAAGQALPESATPATPLTNEQLNGFQHLSLADMQPYLTHFGALQAGDLPQSNNLLPNFSGRYYVVIEPGTNGAAWPYGFTLRAALLQPGDGAAQYSYDVPEVFVLLSGDLEIGWDDENLTLHAGDVFTCPPGLPHRFTSTGNSEAVLYHVVGGETATEPDVRH